MTVNVLQLATCSVKIALLVGLMWALLYLLRRAPALSRSRLCSVALIAVVMVWAGELLSTRWALQAPVYAFAGAAAAARGVATSATRVDLGWWLGTLWISGAMVMLARVIVGRVLLARLRRRCRQADRAEGVDVRIVPIQTPVLCGIIHPTILLPESSAKWTKGQLNMVLAHELTHHRHGDARWILLAQVVRATFWFHPAVWMLVARLSREQELACDEAVIAAGYPARDYAAFLVDAARDLKSSDLLACAMAGSGAGSLKARVAQLLEPVPRLRARRRMLVALASLSMISFGLTGIQPVWSQQRQERKAYKPGNGVMQPRLLYKVDPDYTQEAKDNRIEGTVLLQTVITEDGRADEITVVRGLDSGLDEKAIEALSKWKFQPGTKDGVPVPVRATIEVNFRLK